MREHNIRFGALDETGVVINGISCFLMDSTKCFEAIFTFATDATRSCWYNDIILHVSLVFRRDGVPLTAHKLFFCSRKKNRPTALVLTDESFTCTIRRVLSYTYTFQLEYDLNFTNLKNMTFAAELLSSELFSRAYHATYRRIVRFAKFFQLHSEAFVSVTWESSTSRKFTHVVDTGSRMALKLFVVPLLQVAAH